MNNFFNKSIIILVSMAMSIWPAIVAGWYAPVMMDQFNDLVMVLLFTGERLPLWLAVAYKNINTIALFIAPILMAALLINFKKFPAISLRQAIVILLFNAMISLSLCFFNTEHGYVLVFQYLLQAMYYLLNIGYFYVAMDDGGNKK